MPRPDQKRRFERKTHANLDLKTIYLSEDKLIEMVEADPMSLILVLDCVQDPHNLGACFRTADAAGVKAIVVPKDKSVQITDTVRHVASGAVENIPFVPVTNLARCLERLKEAGLWIFGTADEADSTVYEQDYSGPVGLVMGAEGQGLRRLTAEKCDHLISIPMQGAVPCLNVSVATGVVLFEIVRQRVRGGTPAQPQKAGFMVEDDDDADDEDENDGDEGEMETVYVMEGYDDGRSAEDRRS
jgi:23S rRNA (guanosine2251-2'-O)-methyltransferase